MINEATEPILFAKAMADETRQRVMSLLCCRWLCVGDIVDELGGISQPTVSHPLSVLREAGLVHARREGKQVFYSLNQDKVAVCCGQIMRVFAPERVDVPLSVVDGLRLDGLRLDAPREE